MAATNVTAITPPVVARPGTSKADAALVAQFVAALNAGDGWSTDGETYSTHKGAGNASQVYRRAVANALRVKPKQVRSRVWETSDAFPPKSRDAKGAWVFALTRRTNTAG